MDIRTVSECLDDGWQERGDGRESAVGTEIDNSSDVDL